MFPRATETAVAGHMWPAGRHLPTPELQHCTEQRYIAIATDTITRFARSWWTKHANLLVKMYQIASKKCQTVSFQLHEERTSNGKTQVSELEPSLELLQINK